MWNLILTTDFDFKMMCNVNTMHRHSLTAFPYCALHHYWHSWLSTESLRSFTYETLEQKMLTTWNGLCDAASLWEN